MNIVFFDNMNSHQRSRVATQLRVGCYRHIEAVDNPLAQLLDSTGQATLLNRIASALGEDGKLIIVVCGQYDMKPKDRTKLMSDVIALVRERIHPQLDVSVHHLIPNGEPILS